jgi:hypothetical protein
MGWAAIGGTLSAIGAPSGVALAIWGASSHLWSDDYFLAGFAAACLLTAIGLYVLVAEFIGDLPLPLTRHEREARRRSQAQDGTTRTASNERPVPLSDTDRRRIARETEGRLAQEIHDPTLRALDKRNKEEDADRQRELIERGEHLKRRVSTERTMIERTGRQMAQEHMLQQWTDAARSWAADAGLATEPPPIGFFATGQPAAQRKELEDWIGECLDALTADA